MADRPYDGRWSHRVQKRERAAGRLAPSGLGLAAHDFSFIDLIPQLRRFSACFPHLSPAGTVFRGPSAGVHPHHSGCNCWNSGQIENQVALRVSGLTGLEAKSGSEMRRKCDSSASHS